MDHLTELRTDVSALESAYSLSFSTGELLLPKKRVIKLVNITIYSVWSDPRHLMLLLNITDPDETKLMTVQLTPTSKTSDVMFIRRGGGDQWVTYMDKGFHLKPYYENFLLSAAPDASRVIEEIRDPQVTYRYVNKKHWHYIERYDFTDL